MKILNTGKVIQNLKELIPTELFDALFKRLLISQQYIIGGSNLVCFSCHISQIKDGTDFSNVFFKHTKIYRN